MTRDITKVDASERQEIANKNNKKNDTRREQTANDNEIITGYKAFDPDFTCRYYQYEVGETFEHGGKIGLCSAGFHFCPKDPLDVFRYYPLVSRESGLPTRYAKVSAPKKDTIVEFPDDKCVTSKITIEEETTLDDLVNEQIKKAYKSEGEAKLLTATGDGTALTDKDVGTKIISNKDVTLVALAHSYSMAITSADYTYLASSGRRAGLFATGEFASLSASGNSTNIYCNGQYSSISSSGERAALRIIGGTTRIASSGAEAALMVEGNYTHTSSSGSTSKLRITGDYAGIASSGYRSELTVTGKRARMAVAGNYSRVTYEGEGGVISVLGIGAKFRGSKGTLVLAVTYDRHGEPTGGLVGRIGENGLKPDTLYTVKNGEFVEVRA